MKYSLDIYQSMGATASNNTYEVKNHAEDRSRDTTNNYRNDHDYD